jgi:hypothetical protein
MMMQRTTQPGCLGGWLAVAAALERTARALGDAAVATTAQLQPSAEALGRALAVEFQNRYYFCEEVFLCPICMLAYTQAHEHTCT